MIRALWTFALAAALCASAGCDRSETTAPADADDSYETSGNRLVSEPAVALGGDARSLLVLDAVKKFRSWSRVSDQARMAPEDCGISPPVGAQMSESDDAPSHGRKLYYLYARHSEDYTWLGFEIPPGSPKTVQPPGQTLIKESFEAVPTSAPAKTDNGDLFTHEYPVDHALLNGQWYRTGEPKGLFVMMYLQADAPETDAGWIYANVEPSGEKVIEIGRIESCMKCHQRAPHGRLFGMPRSRSRAQP